jgi:D-3-phosphoglycerate dehydrogenase
MPKDNPLLAMDNVIITPHIAGGSAQHAKVATEFAAQSALSLVAGRLPKIVVNPTAIPAWAERFKATGIRYGGVVYYRA